MMQYLLLLMVILSTPATATIAIDKIFKCNYARSCDLADKLADQVAITESLKESLAKQELEMTLILERLTTLENATTPIKPASGFYADMGRYISFPVTAEKDKPVIFPRVLTNVGENYNNVTGYYTASCNGIYFIGLSFLSSFNHNDATELGIYSQDQGYCIALANGVKGTSMTDRAVCWTIVSLDQGETVSVRLYDGNGEIQNGYHTSFSAVLIQCY